MNATKIQKIQFSVHFFLPNASRRLKYRFQIQFFPQHDTEDKLKRKILVHKEYYSQQHIRWKYESIPLWLCSLVSLCRSSLEY